MFHAFVNTCPVIMLLPDNFVHFSDFVRGRADLILSQHALERWMRYINIPVLLNFYPKFLCLYFKWLGFNHNNGVSGTTSP